MKIETLIRVTDPDTNWIKEKIEEAGTQIGSVHFRKRSDNSLRKMCYRLHVKNPSTAITPKGIEKKEVKRISPVGDAYVTKLVCKTCGREKSECSRGPFELRPVKVTKNIKSEIKKISKKDIDKANTQVTVLDVNKVVYQNGAAIGRGAWRTVPLENVERICNKGTIYEIRYSK